MDQVFPSTFLWGTASSAHQVEGGNTANDIWLLEQVAGSPFIEPSGAACDHYTHYEADIALMAQLGFNAYRFSLEWSRIEPEEGRFSAAALDHYRRMLAACHAHGLRPIVTFHHFTSPQWLIRDGGWQDRRTPDRFARYCARAADHLGDLIDTACTINEPNISPFIAALGAAPLAEGVRQAAWWQAAAAALGVAPGQFAPFLFALSPQAREIVLLAHRRAVEAIKSSRADCPVGLTLVMPIFEPVDDGEAMAERLRYDVNGRYLEALDGDDFVGVQTYSRFLCGPEGLRPPPAGVEQTQMGYEFYPEALEAGIREAVAVARLPVIVTEHGVATTDDSRRIEFMRRAVRCLANCLADGLDVRGYCYWSIFDNFEWTLGYGPQFGLIAVDRLTQARYPKPSAGWMGAVACSNGLAIPDEPRPTGAPPTVAAARPNPPLYEGDTPMD
jgi:beta-glucosidase